MGAIGFTLEHDLHRFILRGTVLDVLYGSARELRVELGRALGGTRAGAASRRALGAARVSTNVASPSTSTTSGSSTVAIVATTENRRSAVVATCARQTRSVSIGVGRR